ASRGNDTLDKGLWVPSVSCPGYLEGSNSLLPFPGLCRERWWGQGPSHVPADTGGHILGSVFQDWSW
ncbi:unnamed protein product, partial [Bubo scandiacus]